MFGFRGKETCIVFSFLSIISSIILLVYSFPGHEHTIILIVMGFTLIFIRVIFGNMNLSRLEDWFILGFFLWHIFPFFKVYQGVDTHWSISDPEYAPCLAITFLGFGSLLLGITLTLFSYKGKLSFTRIPVKSSVIFLLIVIIFVIYWTICRNNLKIDNVEREWYWNIIDGLRPIIGTLSFYIFYNKNNRSFLRRISLFVFIIWLVTAIINTSRTDFGAGLFGILYMTRFKERDFIVNNIRKTVLLSSAMLLFYVVANIIRSMSPGFGGLAKESFKSDFTQAALYFRGLQNEDLFLCYSLYPKQTRFLYGETYLQNIIVFIPRSYWPNKPLGIGKHLAARASGVLGDFQLTRDVDSKILREGSNQGTMLGEAWANFGWFGIILVPMFLGIFVRWFSDLRMRAAGNEYFHLVYSQTLFTVLVFSRNFALTQIIATIGVIIALDLLRRVINE